MDALQALRDKEQGLRLEVKTLQAHVVILEGEISRMSLSPTRGGSQDLAPTQTTPARRQARAALLAQPMDEWTEAQVQDWIALIGLPADKVEHVKRAMEDLEGADLEEMGKRQLQRLLKKAGADDAAGLAQQALELHEAAQGGAGTEGRMTAAQAELVAARQALRDNSNETKLQVKDLAYLAATHFPELLHSHEDVKLFMGSDGLQVPDRRLADYDDRQTLPAGRSKLLRAKLDGIDVVLKEFPLQNERAMGGYLKEIVNVQRLNHRHIIRYKAVFESEGSMYIEMDYCKHGSLISWVQATNPNSEQKKSVLRQVLLGLACMHDQKIVHCDIKGDNILIGNDGSALICDFELSKDLSAASASTMVGGTRGFFAPEVLVGAKPSAASDMYSYGVLALNLLLPPAPADYPLTDASVVAGMESNWVALLMHEDPAKRPTAVQLAAEPYFEADNVPDNWSNRASGGASARVSCDNLRIGSELVQRMMRQSIEPGHENGCQRGADLRNFRVTRLERVENVTLWLNYQRQKTALRERMLYHGHAPVQLHTDHLVGERVVDAEINEFGLWHGTKPEVADILATAGFDERVADLRGLYGAGSYFADTMCKSNQYSTQVNAAGEHCMLYCRVTMGSAFKTAQTHQNLRRPEDNPATPGAPFDSIFAETGVANRGHQAHNEFVVFRHDQVYPEYIVWYTAG
jgi:hypothetical protein